MNTVLQNDLKQLASILHAASGYSLNFLEGLSDFPTGRPTVKIKAQQLPEKGIGAMGVLDHFDKHYKDILVASSGPRYFGYVTGGTTPASILGDWLTTAFDQNTQSTNGPGDISAIIEKEAIDLLLDFFNLPRQSFHGGFVTGATMSNFTCLGVARQWLGKQYGLDIAKQGMIKPINCLAATPHSSAVKCLSMLGIGSQNIQLIPAIEEREAMDMDAFEEKLVALKGEPFILISSGGTVNTVDFDDMQRIAELKKKYNFWWHIDAAFGGFAAALDSYKHLLMGWELADSITIDAHKWLNVPYDSAIFFIRNEHALIQTETYQNSNAPYLGNPMENFAYHNFLPENSRRFRALPVWFSLLAYGKQGYQSIVENCIDLAQKFSEEIVQSNDFELLAPVRLNVVAFTFKHLSEASKAALIPKFMKRMDERGKIFMTPTHYNGQHGFRAAFVNWQTTSIDIQIAINELYNIFQDVAPDKQTISA